MSKEEKLLSFDRDTRASIQTLQSVEQVDIETREMLSRIANSEITGISRKNYRRIIKFISKQGIKR